MSTNASSARIILPLARIGRLAVTVGLLSLVSMLTYGSLLKSDHKADSDWTQTFPLEEFSSTGTNPYFILKPGYFLILAGIEERKEIQLTITVLDQTKIVNGVETRVVEESEKNVSDDKLIEVSRNYFAIGKLTNSVYYFGEDVDIYKDGKIADHQGSWLSGVDEAKFGVAMPGIPLIGSRYYQELAPGHAMDRAETVSLTERIETPAGSFTNCLKVAETTPLEPHAKEFKAYASGIGLVQDNSLRLLKHGTRK